MKDLFQLILVFNGREMLLAESSNELLVHKVKKSNPGAFIRRVRWSGGEFIEV